jgi:adenylosuccinate lyase
METRDIFLNISPLDHRYSMSDRVLYEELARYFSEQASLRYCIAVELALVRAHANMRGIADFPFNELDGLENRIDPAQVYAEEEKTRHNIRALVNVMKMYVPQAAKAFVHLGATSVDILDTAQALRIRDGVRSLILPRLISLQRHLLRLSSEHADTPQVGRTHGQFAVPLTLGYWFSGFASRLGKSIINIDSLASDLRGKMAGAVGAYNASSMLYADPIEFERLVLKELDLEPSDHATQMVEPEYVLRLLLEINTAFGIVADLADDLRHLQRSEIDELREYFAPEQVGSSTMPQKRNPWNAEHVKSLWKAFSPRVVSFYMDQISEHQRDLTNSASSRFIMDYLAGFCLAISRMSKILDGLSINKARLEANLIQGGAGVLAEPAYILLSEQGDVHAHETIRRLTLQAEQNALPFIQVLQADTEVWGALTRGLAAIGAPDPQTFFANPANYRGKAAEKTQFIVQLWNSRINNLEASLKQRVKHVSEVQKENENGNA